MADPWAAFPTVGGGDSGSAPPAADPWAAFPVANEVQPPDEAVPPPGPGVNTTVRPGAAQAATAAPAGSGDSSGGWANSYGQNLGRQAMQGVTFGFADEIGAGLGALKAFLTDDEYGDLYNKILERNRAQDKAFSEENPVTSTAAQVAGGLATAPFTPMLQAARGAGLGARMAAGAGTAAGYGALYGAGTGEGAEDRAEGAATGALFGAGAGAALPALGAGLRAAGGAVAAPFRGAVGADKEAARRVGMAFEADGIDIPSAQRTLDMARQGDVPLIAADTGGEMVRAVARSAANTSPPAREKLQLVTEDRWLAQGDRVRRLTQAVTGAQGDNDGLILRLRDAARQANKPAYTRAYQDGASGIWDAELQQLATSPTFQQAMRAAERIGRDDAALSGFPPVRQPFNFAPDGTVSLKPGVTPNLQFWDYVHRGLQRSAETASKKSKSQAAQISELNRRLTDHLDIAVPSFGQARAGAAAFFGARDAVEAGAMFVTDTKLENAAVRRGFTAFTKPEKEMAREGMASTILHQIEGTSDRVNVANKIFASPRARERIEIVLGPEAARRLEAMVRVENVMSMTKQAVSGGSDTVRKLAEAGLAGGATGAWYGSGDPTSIGTGALLGALLRGGSRHIDARVARRVGEMLASDDPKVLKEAARMVANNKRMMEAVRTAEARIARSLAPVHPEVSLRNMVGGATDERDQPRGDGGR